MRRLAFVRLAVFLVLVFAWVPLQAGTQETAAELIKKMVVQAADNANGQYTSSLTALYQQLEALPKPPPGDKKKAQKFYELGKAAFKAEDREQAKKHYLEARKADPSDVDIAKDVAFVELLLMNYFSVEPAIFAAIALSPDENSWTMLAVYYVKANRPRYASATFTLLLKFSRDPTTARSTIENYSKNSKDANIRQAAQEALSKYQETNQARPSAASPAPIPAPQAAPPQSIPASTPAPKQAAPSPPPAPVAATISPSPAPKDTPVVAETDQDHSIITLVLWLWAKLLAAIAAFDIAVLWGWPLAVVASLVGLVISARLWKRSADHRRAAANWAIGKGSRFIQWLKQLGQDVVWPAARFLFRQLRNAALLVKRYPSAVGALIVLVLGYLFLPRWVFVLALGLPLLVLAWNRYPAPRQALLDFFNQQVAPRLRSWVPLFWKLATALLNAAQYFLHNWLRILIKWMIYGAWIAAVVWLVSSIDHNSVEFEKLSSTPYYITNPGITQGAYYQAAIYNVKLHLAFWALLGAMGLAVLWFIPNHFIKGNRLGWLALAVSLFLGYPALEWAAEYFLYVPGWIRFLVEPLALSLAGMLSSVGLFIVVSLVVGIFIGPLIVFFNQIMQYQIGMQVFRHKRVGLMASLLSFFYWLRGEEWPDTPDDSKGARFATREEINTLHHPQGAAFGHVNGTPLRLVTDKHILIMASTRSGKGVAIIIPHLLRYRGSAFVLDPKGENARATQRHRKTLNDEVHFLDPFGLSGQTPSRFNPLARFTPENMEAESKSLASALVMGEGGHRDHWTASAQQLLAALILYVYASPEVPPERKDLPTVRRLLLGAMDQPQKNHQESDQFRVLESMSQSDLADGLLADLAASFLNTPPNEYGSILSTAQRETEILDNPHIAASLAASGPGEEVDFAAWHRGTMTVYLCLSAPKFPVFSRWLRLVLTSAIDEMTDRLDPPPLPVCFMLDELATLGHLQAVENAVGLAAGYRIQLWAVFQDVAQMRDIYRGRWASFVNNAGIRAIFNLDDIDTAEYWSKTIGGRLEATTSYSKDVYGLIQGQSSGETFRPLLAPEEVMRQFASVAMLVLAQGSFPVMAQRVPYYQDPELDGLWDDPRRPVDKGPPKPDGDIDGFEAEPSLS